MSLKANVFANYVSQIYVTLISILMVPVLLRYMGTEAYGLVGFFAMLQAWFQVLDLGFAAAMSREAARWKGGAAEAWQLRHLLRTVEKIFAAIGLVGLLLILAGSSFVAEKWLQIERLDAAEVRRALMLMSLAALLRWASGLYRGFVAGVERQVWLGVFSMLVATVRFVLVIPFFLLVGTGPSIFFGYQLAIALVELGVLAVMTYRLFPVAGAAPAARAWRSSRFRGMVRFSMTMALASAVWALATQTDKLVLSKILPLSEFGYFSIAVVVAGAVLMVSGPVGAAILPRLSQLEFVGDRARVIDLYRNATQLVAVISGPVAIVLAFFPEHLLWMWTGDALTVSKAAPVLALYAAGYGFLVIGAFPYYLQYAKGDLRLHLVGSLLFVMVMVPLLIWATPRYGTVGAGWAWLIANVLYFFLWVPVAHHQFLRNMHMTWLVRDVVPPILPAILFASVLRAVLPWPQQRMLIALELAGAGVLVAVSAALGSRAGRHQLWLLCYGRSRGADSGRSK